MCGRFNLRSFYFEVKRNCQKNSDSPQHHRHNLCPDIPKLFLGHPTLREGMAKHSAERRQWITEHYKPEHQQKALADFEKTEAMSEKMVPIVFIVFGAVLPLLLAVIPIYFFTRPKVKEQFK